MKPSMSQTMSKLGLLSKTHSDNNIHDTRRTQSSSFRITFRRMKIKLKDLRRTDKRQVKGTRQNLSKEEKFDAKREKNKLTMQKRRARMRADAASLN